MHSPARQVLAGVFRMARLAQSGLTVRVEYMRPDQVSQCASYEYVRWIVHAGVEARGRNRRCCPIGQPLNPRLGILMRDYARHCPSEHRMSPGKGAVETVMNPESAIACAFGWPLPS